jgi:hypothetical protein
MQAFVVGVETECCLPAHQTTWPTERWPGRFEVLSQRSSVRQNSVSARVTYGPDLVWNELPSEHLVISSSPGSAAGKERTTVQLKG